MPGSVNAAHFGVTVVDLDRVCGFLVNCLGFVVNARVTPADPTIVARIIGVPGAWAEIAYLDGPGASVELLAYRTPDDRVWLNARPCDVGAMHLSFHVEELDRIVVDAERFGFRPIAPPASPEHGPRIGKRAVYLRDADGMVVELMER